MRTQHVQRNTLTPVSQQGGMKMKVLRGQVYMIANKGSGMAKRAISLQGCRSLCSHWRVMVAKTLHTCLSRSRGSSVLYVATVRQATCEGAQSSAALRYE